MNPARNSYSARQLASGVPAQVPGDFRNLILAAFFALLTTAIPLVATQSPELERPADIQTLRLAKSSADISLTCTDGVGPTFSYARNNLVTFGDPASLVVASGGACAFTDLNELSQPNTRFYFLADSQAPPRVMDASPLALKPGDTLTVRGVGLKGATLRTPRGTAITPTVDTARAPPTTCPSPGNAADGTCS